ncbi:MAG: RNA polymerase sigma factor, partial [Bacteroidota bacterium]|nr:RNA polymerase sigma factor [Bacteroidota bacterium]
ITYYHRNYRYRYHSDIEESQETGVYVHEEGDCEFTKEELLNVVTALPPGYKMVFNLYAIEGYKHKEIATMLDIDVNTSKSQYSRAKKLIRDKLEELSKTKKSSTML